MTERHCDWTENQSLIANEFCHCRDESCMVHTWTCRKQCKTERREGGRGGRWKGVIRRAGMLVRSELLFPNTRERCALVHMYVQCIYTCVKFMLGACFKSWAAPCSSM